MLDKIIKQYLASCEMAGQAKDTIKGKVISLNRFSAFVGDRELTPQIAFEYVFHLKTKEVRPYKANSLKYEITLLKTFEKFMLENNYCAPWTNLIKRPNAGTSLKNFVYVDPILIDKAIVAGTEPKPFIRRGLPGDNARNAFIKLETRECLKFVSRKGLRISEALRLTGKDLNFDAAIPEFRIAPSKGQNEIWTQIPADMVEEMRKLKDKRRVFETTEETCNLSIQRGWEALKLPGDPHNHMLRHQHAAHLLKNGVRMEQVQKEMRHKSIKVTIDTYGHLLNSDVDPLVQAADPRTRKALGYERQVSFVKKILESLHLSNDNVKVEWMSNEGEFVFKMRRA